MMTKQELRQLIRQRKRLHAAGESVAVMEQLMANARFREAHTFLLYSALPDEVPTQDVLDSLVSAGKTVLLPRVTDDTDMELRRYTGAADLSVGAFGIMEPTGELFDQYSLIDVAVVPGMAFDRHGHRLGRGRGYYDRFLARVPLLYNIGLCFPWQLVSEVPTDATDVTMDAVVVAGARQ